MGCSSRLLHVLVLSMLSILAVGPASADVIEGSNDSDNNSFTFPFWRGQLTGTADHDIIYGRAGHDLLYGRAGDDTLHGDEGPDRLYGELGDDWLAGGFGDRDSLHGGPGNDVYQIFDYEDVVLERVGEGSDSVIATADFILPPNVEALRLSPDPHDYSVITPGNPAEIPVLFTDDCANHPGWTDPCRSIARFGMGNALDNLVVGNGTDNVLLGLDGSDFIVGGDADDELDGGHGDDVLAGFVTNGSPWSTETDRLTGGEGADLFVTGISGREGGLIDRLPSSLEIYEENEQFPQYLGQGSVDIMDFQRQEGDKIEVYGDIDDYFVEVGCAGACLVIFWDGTAEGHPYVEPIARVWNTHSIEDVVPAEDFL